MDKRHILIVMLSNLDSEPRVYRQLKALAPNYRLSTAGFDPSQEPGVCHWRLDSHRSYPHQVGTNLGQKLDLKLPAIARRLKVYCKRAVAVLRLKLGLYEHYYWSQPAVRSLLERWQAEGKPHFDCVIVHDQELLPVCLKIAQTSPVLLDAHEYYPAQQNTFKFRFFLKHYRHWLCQKYMPLAAGMVTVSSGIVQEYRQVYGMQASLVYNAPFYQNLHPQPVNPGLIKMVHHGIPARERGLENMIELFHDLDQRFQLDFYLMNNQGLDYLQELQAQAAVFGDRIRFLDPVPMPELPQHLNAYDIGLCLIQPWNFNYANCLPNKFFEYIQARLAVAIGPTPDMQTLAQEYGFGIITTDFSASALAAKLNCLSAEAIEQLKHKAHAAATSLSAEFSQQVLVDKIESILPAASLPSPLNPPISLSTHP